MASHLFLVANAAGFGEISIGLRLARQLAARGERVVFLAPRDASVLLAGQGARLEPIDEAFWDLPRRVRALCRKEGCASVVLVDVTAVMLALQTLCVDIAWLEGFEVPVVALDFWDLRRAGAEWDLGGESWPLPLEARRLARRLVPAPLARAGTPGGFDALPDPPAAEGGRREAERAALGLGPRDKLLLFTSSRFQSPELQVRKAGRRLAEVLPEWAARTIDRLGGAVHVAHVGPAPFASWQGLGSRYRWLGQVPGERFQGLLAAADTLLSFNTTGATTMAAVAAGVPVVAAHNSRLIRSVDEAPAALGREPGDALREWLGRVVPLHPFHVWGLGLFHFLEPVLRDNPYLSAFAPVEVLDEEALLSACHGLLFEEAAREDLRRRQHAFRDSIRGEPSAAEAFVQALSST